MKSSQNTKISTDSLADRADGKKDEGKRKETRAVDRGASNPTTLFVGRRFVRSHRSRRDDDRPPGGGARPGLHNL